MKPKPSTNTFGRRLWQMAASVQTGIVLLLVVVVVAAAGTFILQRPMTEASEMERAYAPATLRWLDALGLTDVFHAGWFTLLLGLLSLNIICASVKRFPQAWRFYAKPYRHPEPHFRRAVAAQCAVPVRDPRLAMQAAEEALVSQGYRPQRIEREGEVSLYVERHRFARLAAYVVHVSLLLVLAGGIIDSRWGYRGFVALGHGDTVDAIELADGSRHLLPFTLRCDAAGQEDYPDGTPRRWWSDLTVLEHGALKLKKQIAVNDPLVYQGVRFYQASFGYTRPMPGARDYFTGLQVSYEPGQWLVWGGCVLMAVGLTLAFYFVHLRLWVVAMKNEAAVPVIWMGGDASKEREDLDSRLDRLAEETLINLKRMREVEARRQAMLAAATRA